MGLQVDLELETNRGPTTELYYRIDSWRINRMVNEITFTTTSWLSKEYADKTLRKYLTDDIPPSVGLVSSKVISYQNSRRGEEIIVDNLYKMSMATELEVDIPIYETKTVTKEHPYVSFDEDGNEVTLYRTVTSQEDVEVGTKKELKQVVDYNIINNLEENCYNYLKLHLEKLFGENNISKIE